MEFIIIITYLGILQNVDPYYFFLKKKISNFRYYNFRLSSSEVLLDYSVMFIFKFYIQIICVRCRRPKLVLFIAHCSLIQGEDPTKSKGTTGASNNCITAVTVTEAAAAAPATDNELSCPKTSEILAGAIIGSFLFGGMVFMAGGYLFLRKSTKRKILEDDGVNNQVVSTQK